MANIPDQIIDPHIFNAAVRAWAAGTEAMMESLVAVDSGDTKQSIGRTYKKSGQQISRIGFPFLRSGIFVEHGAHTGHGGRVGSRWLTSKGESRSTNPASLGKMGTGSRAAKPWIKPSLEAMLPDLNEIVTQYYAGACARANNLSIDFKK
jgi:hypothetical protein